MIRKTKYNLQHLSLYNERSPVWLTNLIDTISEEVHPDVADELKLLSGKALKSASEAVLELARHRVCSLRLERLLDALQEVDEGFIWTIKSALLLHQKAKNNPWAWEEIHNKLKLHIQTDCSKLRVQDRLWIKAALKSVMYTQSSISESAICYCMSVRAKSSNPDDAWQLAWSDEVKALENVLELLKGGKIK